MVQNRWVKEARELQKKELPPYGEFTPTEPRIEPIIEGKINPAYIDMIATSLARRAEAEIVEFLKTAKERGFPSDYIEEYTQWIRDKANARATEIDTKLRADLATQAEAWYRREELKQPVWSERLGQYITPEQAADEEEVLRNLAFQRRTGISAVSGRALDQPTAPEYKAPSARYAPAFEETAGGLTGPQPWKDWFRQRFSTLYSKYAATLPRAGTFPSEREALTETERVEKGWADYLKRETPKLREEYATRYPQGFEAEPRAYQPAIKTVKF